jgi:hypothetical protein
MSEPALPQYQRLPGTGYRQMVPNWAMVLLFFAIFIFVLLLRGRRAQLWHGGDHLLLVERDGAREYYKRIRFADIQAFTIERTSDALATNVCLGILFLLFLGLAAAFFETWAVYFLLFMASLFAIGMAANVIAGPTCRCYVQTAVQLEQIAALARVRPAWRAWERIRPMIAHAQGDLSREGIQERLEAVDSSSRSPGGWLQPLAADDPNVPPRIAG